MPVATPGAQARWRQVRPCEVIVGERQRSLSPEHVTQLRNSFAKLGGHLQLQPIVLDPQMRLIDGAHRLEAAKQAGWRYIFAVVLHDLTPADHALLEAEANLVRKNLSPLEIETVWRTHYEPSLRAQARARQLSGLRQGANARAQTSSSDSVASSRVNVAAIAKQITGLSLHQLRAIGEIRVLSTSLTAAPELRAAAAHAMRGLEVPGASIAAARRRVAAARRDIAGAADRSREAVGARSGELVLERALADTSALAQRLAQKAGRDIEELARHSAAQHDSLRGLRTSLTHALAQVVAIECRLAKSPLAAMAHIGAEVGALHSRLLRAQLSPPSGSR